jgi:hypothetical protein
MNAGKSDGTESPRNGVVLGIGGFEPGLWTYFGLLARDGAVFGIGGFVPPQPS